MTGSTRVAVCGLGNIGAVHAENLRGLRGCTVAGVCDARIGRARAVADRLGSRVYEDFDDLLSDPSIDAVVVATPASHHREAVLAALAAGKHVFVEKPLANDLEDAIAIDLAARASDRVVQVGFCERFNPQYLEAKRAVPSLGRVGSVQSSRVAPLALGDLSWPLGPLDTAVHNFDLILWLTGARPASVRAFGARIAPSTRRDTAITSVIRFEGGAVAVDHVAWVDASAHPLGQCARSRMALYGERGVFELDLNERPSSLLNAGGYSRPDTVILGGPGYSGCLKAQFDAFLGAIERGGPSPVPTAAGVAAEALAIAAQESLRTGEEVRIAGATS